MSHPLSLHGTVAAFALWAGCATGAVPVGPEPDSFARAFARAQAQVSEGAPVRIDGLDFLQLGAPTNEALATMGAHGYECHPAAATRRYAPCSATAPGVQPDPVVLEIEAGCVIAVEARIAPRDGDPRGLLDAMNLRMRGFDYPALVDELPSGVALRALPGDGSLVDVSWRSGAGSLRATQRLLQPPAPRSPGMPTRLVSRSVH